jgi:hypothetical protein
LRLFGPHIIEANQKRPRERKTIKGTTIAVAIVSPDDSKTEDAASETNWQIKLVLKPVFK